MRSINTRGPRLLTRLQLAALLLLTSATLCAGMPAGKVDSANKETSSANDQANGAPTVGRYELARRKLAARPPAAQSANAGSSRVYLEDYDRVHQAVTRQYSTEAHVLGQKDKAKKKGR